MKTLSTKLAAFTVMVLVLIASANVKADTAENGNQQPAPSVVREKTPFGPGSVLPVVSETQLATDMQKYRETLENHKQDLVGMLEDNKFKASDVVLTAIMPGGLLYAAYRANQLEKTRKQYAEVNALIDELGEDLVAWKAANGKIMVAKWP